MSLTKIKIENFKSIKKCNINLIEKNLFIGENGSGKSTILEAIDYFYKNLVKPELRTDVFDENNHYSNEIKITITYNLSEFNKIIKAQVRENRKNSSETPARYTGYYKKILSLSSKNYNHTISLEFSQIKNKGVQWNYPYETRQLLKNLFPIFYIDAKQLDVTKWNYIWEMFGEIAKIANEERKNIETDVKALLHDKQSNMSKKIYSIENILNNSNTNIMHADSKIFARNLLKLFFSGEQIQQKGKKLEYFSTGTNAVKYLQLFLISVDELSRIKLKEPIILLDEPEISLHHQFIDELTESICNLSSKPRMLIATHSPRLIKNIMIGNQTVLLYNIKFINMYTNVIKMNRFIQYSPSSKYRVTDDHINSYFSKFIIFVEGETELEFFSNPYLRELFPLFKKIDVFKAMSDQPILNIMNPKQLGIKTPHVMLIDMDKVLDFKLPDHKLVLKNEYIKKRDKEYFYFYGKKEHDTYLQHKYQRIVSAVEKLKLHFYLPFYSCKDPNYLELIDLIKDYLLSYNVFAFKTTIEGALINKNSFTFTLQFLENQYPAEIYEEFYTIIKKYFPNDQINALRYIFKGKSDLFQYKKIQIKNDTVKDTFSKMQKKVGKASGWISDYLDTFFKTHLDNVENFSLKNFQHYLELEENKEHVEKIFKNCFPEMYSLIKYIYDIIGNYK